MKQDTIGDNRELLSSQQTVVGSHQQSEYHFIMIGDEEMAAPTDNALPAPLN